VFVVSSISTLTDSSECLSDDPGKIFPEVVLCGDKSDLVDISCFLIGVLLGVLPVGEGKFKSFSFGLDLSEESGAGGVEVVLEGPVVVMEGILLVGEEGIELDGLVVDGVLEGSRGIISVDFDLLLDAVGDLFAVWLVSVGVSGSEALW